MSKQGSGTALQYDQSQQAARQFGGTQQQTQSQGYGQGTTEGGLRSPTFETRNYLPQEVRERAVQALNRVLADTAILRTQAEFAHWNAKGPAFYGLHELFKDIAEAFEDQADLIAERITAVGGTALGATAQAVALRRVPPMPTNLVDGMDYVRTLANHLATHDAHLHEAIRTVQGYDDIDTVDLLNEVSREVSEYLWFLEAHLQNQPVSSVPVRPETGARGQQPPGQQPSGQQPSGQQPPGQQF